MSDTLNTPVTLNTPKLPLEQSLSKALARNDLARIVKIHVGDSKKLQMVTLPGSRCDFEHLLNKELPGVDIQFLGAERDVCIFEETVKHAPHNLYTYLGEVNQLQFGKPYQMLSALGALVPAGESNSKTVIFNPSAAWIDLCGIASVKNVHMFDYYLENKIGLGIITFSIVPSRGHIEDTKKALHLSLEDKLRVSLPGALKEHAAERGYTCVYQCTYAGCDSKSSPMLTMCFVPVDKASDYYVSAIGGTELVVNLFDNLFPCMSRRKTLINSIGGTAGIREYIKNRAVTNPLFVPAVIDKTSDERDQIRSAFVQGMTAAWVKENIAPKLSRNALTAIKSWLGPELINKRKKTGTAVGTYKVGTGSSVMTGPTITLKELAAMFNVDMSTGMDVMASIRQRLSRQNVPYCLDVRVPGYMGRLQYRYDLEQAKEAMVGYKSCERFRGRKPPAGTVSAAELSTVYGRSSHRLRTILLESGLKYIKFGSSKVYDRVAAMQVLSSIKSRKRSK